MRFAISTLGCKVNQYDSAVIEERLVAEGFERTEFEEPADVYIVNTCTVTDRADAENRRMARRARRLNPRARVIMTGCMAQASPEKLEKCVEADAIVGLGRLEDLVRAAKGEEGISRRMVSNLRREKPTLTAGAAVPSGQTRAFLKVQEGCDQFCTYCIVPFSRGGSRSVEPRQVLQALDALYERGFKEVILTGVHLGGYGRDLAPSIDLYRLLEMIAERCPIDRVRLSSIDPEELSDPIIELIAGCDKFCRHFHLPLQAGEDELLARMRRRYRSQEFSERLARIIERMPEAAVGTDLIVGFPGETPGHFERYLNFIAALPLAYFHVFPYSVRIGTSAAKFQGRVAAEEIKRRAETMRELGEGRRKEFARRFVGSKLKVLVEETRDPISGLLRGYSRNYIKTLIEGPDDLKNHEVPVEASGVGGGAALVGRLARPRAGSPRQAQAG